MLPGSPRLSFSRLPFSRLRFAFVASLLIGLTLTLHDRVIGQTVLWSDDFESYTPQVIPALGSVGGWTDDGALLTAIDGTSSLSGQNSLRLDEGPGGDTNGDGMFDANDNNGKGSFIYLNFPQTYTTGAYTLKFSQFIEGSVDSIHRAYFNERVYPESNSGLDIDYDAQGLLVQNNGVGVPVTVPWQILDVVDNNGNPAFSRTVAWDVDAAGVGIADATLRQSEWIEQQLNVDLDNNTFEWIYNGITVTTYGTRAWDSVTSDAAGPEFSGLALFFQETNENANSNGVLGSIYYDDFVLTQVTPGMSLVCDADSDDDCDLVDINLLYQAFGTSGALDLDGSGTIDADDIDDWLVAASDTTNPYKADAADVYILGDVNLDGDVDSVDLGQLLNNFQSTAGVGWNGGDLDGDSTVDSVDLGLLLNNFGSVSAASAAVPEPNTLFLLLIATGLLATRRR